MAVSTIKNDGLTVEGKTTTVQFSNASTKEVTVDISKDGYTPIGVMGYSVVTSANFYVLRAYVSGNTLYLYLVQRAGTAVTQTINVNVYIAYQPT